ncbi:MAG: hypothetical protein KatS3mg078_0375 [Deltaproteobacteria bacterium]|nr:MAG: hypothetical protein KatS3mg078_0375 [Deltaproteobacteria bacterium]
MKNESYSLLPENPSEPIRVKLKWSEVLESAFEYYKSEYTPAWALEDTPFNKAGDKIYIWKRNGEWVSWENVESSERPHIVTLFDLLPDLPTDEEFSNIIRDFELMGIKDPENHFWENVFSYRRIDEVMLKDKVYKIQWEA